MDVPLLALAVELALLGAAVAVALLLVFQVRLAKRHDALGREVQRLKKAQHDGAVDARTRLEEAMQTLEALGGVEGIAQGALARADEVERRLEAVAPRLDQAAARGEQAEESLRQAEARLGRAEEAAADTAERLGGMEERVRAAEAEVGALSERFERLGASVEARLGPPPRPRRPEPEARAAPVMAAAPETVPDTEPEVEEIALDAEEAAPAVRLTRREGDFTFEGEHEEGESPGLQTLLILVVVLAVGTMVVHWLVT